MSASVAEEKNADESFGPDRKIIQGLWNAKPWIAAGFMITSFVIGVALFVILVTLIAVGGGLIITLIGIPILMLAFEIWKGAADLERQRIRFFFGVTIPAPYRPLPEGSYFKRLRGQLSDPAVWRDLLYDFLLFPIGIAEFVIAVFALTFPLVMLAAPSYFWFADFNLFGDSSTGAGWQVDSFPEAMLVCAVGALMLILCGWLLIGVTKAHVAAAKWMLGPSRTEKLEERVDVLTKTRSDVMDAMMIERRRIERDLHDGAQQRLVSLAMSLGMAKAKMESDPEAAQALVETSHEEAKQVLSELRELVRGIHPAVLTDRGLDAAISSIAGRCPVPVTVNVQMEKRPPEAVESTAYFIVAEALTNVAKHSNATQASVRVMQEPGLLRLDIWDNGVGGATMTSDHGLGGLKDRVAALDGRFAVVSPLNGGTRVFAEIPCVS